MSLDARFMLWLHGHAARSRMSRGFTRFAATYIPVLMIASYAAAVWLSSESATGKWTALLVPLAAGFVARFVIGALLRGAVRRPRPYRSYGLKPLIPIRSHSFPSSHAMFFSAFSLAAFAFMPVLGALLLALTLCVCVARIAAGIHYPSDMLAGIAVGFATAWAILVWGAAFIGVPAW